MERQDDENGVKDIARQLVEDAPGSELRVILGGGRASFDGGTPAPDKWTCTRKDGRNLIQKYVEYK